MPIYIIYALYGLLDCGGKNKMEKYSNYTYRMNFALCTTRDKYFGFCLNTHVCVSVCVCVCVCKYVYLQQRGC